MFSILNHRCQVIENEGGSMMKRRLSILAVMVLILLCGCTAKKVENKTPENKDPQKKVEDIKIVETATENGHTIYEANKIYNLGQSAKMDVDGDGKKDTITFESVENELRNGIENFQITINGNKFVGEGTRFLKELMALSLDGKELILITYEDGPSGDPLSIFYRYHEGRFEKIGNIFYDIRRCEVKDNEIFGLFSCDLIQTQLAYGSWKINTEGKLEQVIANEYNLYNEPNATTLIKNLPVHKEKNLSSEKSIITPQKITFTKSDAKNWTYVEGADGTGGWVYTNSNRVIEELGLAAGEVFENLVLYD